MKSATADKFTVKPKGSVECWDHYDKMKTISQINQKYLASAMRISPTFSKFLLWNRDRWEHHIGIKIYENKKIYVQTGKVVQLKAGSC